MRLAVPVPDKDPRRQLGELIQRARVELDLSHQDVSRRVGAAPQTVKRWETGEDVPRGVQWVRLKGSLRRLGAAAQVWRAALDQMAGIERVDAIQEVHTARNLEANGIASDVTPPPEPIGLKPEDPPPPLPDPAKADSFGIALAMARVQEGLAQSELGQLLGVVQQVVSSWERGNAYPILDHYEKLRALFPVLDRAPKPPSRDIAKPNAMTYTPPTRTVERSDPAPAIARVTAKPEAIQAAIDSGRLPRAATTPPRFDSVEEAGIALARAKRTLFEKNEEIRSLEEDLEKARQDAQVAQSAYDAAIAALDEAIRKP